MGFRSIQVGGRQALRRGTEEELFAARERSPHDKATHSFKSITLCGPMASKPAR
jgi:hypothetical protein